MIFSKGNILLYFRSGPENLTIIFPKTDKRNSWEELINETKQKLCKLLTIRYYLSIIKCNVTILYLILCEMQVINPSTTQFLSLVATKPFSTSSPWGPQYKPFTGFNIKKESNTTNERNESAALWSRARDALQSRWLRQNCYFLTGFFVFIVVANTLPLQHVPSVAFLQPAF